ncbi:MAG: CsbD family protein [Rhodocyclales bacterium]|nr:CsbD family protein [Rhodocyclales bacterium]
MNKDQIKGAAKKVGGKIEEAAGKVTRSSKLEAKGDARQVEGTVQKNYGDAKADMKKVIRRS